MIKDLTTLKWRKSIYYVSDSVIFEIRNSKNPSDVDGCGTYLIDVENAPDFVKSAKDGTLLNLSGCPEVFFEHVPYLMLEFVSPGGNFIYRYAPLQYIIEEGDKISGGKAVQEHPDIFDKQYIHKFNQDVFDFIKGVMKGKKAFDPKNTQAVLNALPDWLTTGLEAKYMTEWYIDNHFLKGAHYNKNLALKGAANPSETFQYKGAMLAIGKCEDGIMADDAEYAIVSFWNEDVVRDAVRALNAERVVNDYSDEIHAGNPVQMLSIDSMEGIAKVIKNVDVAYNPYSLTTLLNVDYGDADFAEDHDAYDVRFESLATDALTYFDYKDRKKAPSEVNVEAVIAEDKEFIDQYIRNNFSNPVDRNWYEVQITMADTYDDEEATGAVSTISDVFQLFETLPEGSFKPTAIIIQHAGENKQIQVFPDAVWVGDNNMYEREPQIVKTFDEAYEIYMGSEYPKIDSRQCVLRAQVGPNGSVTPPQYIFGNVHTQFYVNALTGEISNVNPLFPDEEVPGLGGNFEEIIAGHKQAVTNRYGNNKLCSATGSCMDFMDDAEYDATKIAEVDSVFKADTGEFVHISENDEGMQMEVLENVSGITVMASGNTITFAEAANVVLSAGRAPHSEKFVMYSEGSLIKYKFGLDANGVTVNARTGIIIDGGAVGPQGPQGPVQG